MSSYLVPRVVSGKTYIQFNPTPQMYAYAMQRGKPENISRRDDEICEQINLHPSNVAKWRKEADPYFSEWLENFLLRNSSVPILKKMLEDVGNQKALEGEFNFWRQMALKHGVIAHEQQTLNIVPVNLSQYDKWTDAELESYRHSLLSAVKGVEEQGGVTVVEASADGGHKGDTGGTGSL